VQKVGLAGEPVALPSGEITIVQVTTTATFVYATQKLTADATMVPTKVLRVVLVTYGHNVLVIRATGNILFLFPAD
jgi:hypothetical protein